MAEIAIIHVLATLPNYLIHEYLVNDVPQRYEVMTGQPAIDMATSWFRTARDSVSTWTEEAIERYPPQGSAIPVDEDPDYDYQYVASHRRRAAWLAN